MSSSRDPHRTDFIVRCECGTEFHTDESHVGKSLRCRCGRTVVVAKPGRGYVPPGAIRETPSHGKRRRHAHQPPAFVPIVPVRRSRWRSPLSGWSFPRAIDWKHGATAMVHSLAGSVRQLNDVHPITRWTARLGWGYLALMIAAWVALITMSESFLPATLLAYGPRIVVLIPLALLFPMALFTARSSLLPLLCATWVGVHSIMGFRVSWETLMRRTLPPVPEAGTVRVLTFNVLEGGRLAFDLPIVLREYAPDLIAFQECGQPLWDALTALPTWYTNRLGSLCTASRWPIRVIDSMPRRDLQRVSQLGAGGTGMAVRLTLDTPHGPLEFVNLHLETVRKGLQAVIGPEGFIPDHPLSAPPTDTRTAESITGQVALNSFIRTVESARASVWAAHGDRSLPLVVAGDFNLPVESAIYRRNWSSMTDAFEASGTGFGWTKREGHLLRVRIDHILMNGIGLRPKRTLVGEDYDSDHLPVIADLVWK